jgi:hypothetical protein
MLCVHDIPQIVACDYKSTQTSQFFSSAETTFQKPNQTQSREDHPRSISITYKTQPPHSTKSRHRKSITMGAVVSCVSPPHQTTHLVQPTTRTSKANMTLFTLRTASRPLPRYRKHPYGHCQWRRLDPDGHHPRHRRLPRHPHFLLHVRLLRRPPSARRRGHAPPPAHHHKSRLATGSRGLLRGRVGRSSSIRVARSPEWEKLVKGISPTVLAEEYQPCSSAYRQRHDIPWDCA